MSDAHPKLVLLRALGLGDLLTAVPAIRALADAFPGHRRVLAAPRSLGALVGLIPGGGGDAPAVHEVADARGLGRLPHALAGADLAVNLHGRGPQSHRLLLATGPGRMIAFRNATVPESRGGARWIAGEHEVDRWCRLLRDAGIAADPERLELMAPPASETSPRSGGAGVSGTSGAAEVARGATLIHPGAASAARRWPAERWAEVARRERRAGRRVLVTGDRSEVGLARRIGALAGLPDAVVLAGRTDLMELARAVQAAGRVACGDTGIGHLATALGTPSVLLFGPTRPSEWGPPRARPYHRVLWAGRTGDPHGRVPDPGLLEIGPDDVTRALTALPGRSRPVASGSAARELTGTAAP